MVCNRLADTLGFLLPIPFHLDWRSACFVDAFLLSVSILHITLPPLSSQQPWYGALLRDLVAVVQAYFSCTFNLERSQTGNRWEAFSPSGFNAYSISSPSLGGQVWSGDVGQG